MSTNFSAVSAITRQALEMFGNEERFDEQCRQAAAERDMSATPILRRDIPKALKELRAKGAGYVRIELNGRAFRYE